MARLKSFTVLSADTFAEGPPSGKFIETNNRDVPFDSQPVQGFSGVEFAPGSEDGSTYWFLSDNGFGSQGNSADYLLRLYKVNPNFAGAENGDTKVEVQDFIQLADPNNLIPFDIFNEDTSDRFLTGADFDTESFVIDNNGDIWVGDEFGPYILHFDSTGTLLEAPIATPNIEISFNSLSGEAPLVIGHRGASGSRPEHTLEAYRLAIEKGADFIEPDLVITADGVLIARHEPLLDDTTNVAEVFAPERQSTKFLDGVETTGYFAEDFTLEEIKQLRAVQPRDFRDQSFNGQFEIPTFQEVIELVQKMEESGFEVGIYPETKHPTFFDQQGLSLEEPLIQTLQNTSFTDPDRIFIQSFEFANLIDLQKQLNAQSLGDIPLVQLYGNTTEGADPNSTFSSPFDIRFNVAQDNDLAAIYGQEFLNAVEVSLSENTVYADLDSEEFLEVISGLYAEGVGTWKNNILLRESLDTRVDGNGDGVAEISTQLTGEITSFIEDAHDAGLQVHPYTLRDEERYLTLKSDLEAFGTGTPQTAEEEFQQLIDIGVDGFFTDFPGTGRKVLEQNDPNLATSSGYKGMAFSRDRQTFYPLLGGTVEGDPDNALRIYEFDSVSSSFEEELVGFYPTDVTGHTIGDFTPINESEFLVIELDDRQGNEAEFKKIFKIDIYEVDDQGFVEKEEIVDLLDIEDPNDLNGDGDTSFNFPFSSIENMLVIDENTILVANDNNYPFSKSRGDDIDNTEIIQIELEQPLLVDKGLLIKGTPKTERLIGGVGDDTIIGLNGADTLAGRIGNDQIIGSRGNDLLLGQDGNDELQGRQGNDHLLGGDGDDQLNGGQGRDRINGGPGDDTLTGGASIDRFIFNSNEEFESDNFGIDTINNFQLDLRTNEDGNQGDLILLDKSSFTELNSTAGIGFSVNNDFETVNTDNSVDDSDAFIVYSEKSGGLFYNVDGESTQFAILDGAPNITEDNFQIRN